MMMVMAAMRGELLLQRTERLLGVDNVAGLQSAADLLQRRGERPLGGRRVLRECGIGLLGAGKVAGVDRLHELSELLLKRIWRGRG